MRDTNHPNWPFKPLGELTDKIGSGATPRGGQSAYKENGTSLIRSLNVHDLEFRYKDLARIDDEQAAALSNVEVEARDVLLNITGASIARCSRVPLDVLPARVNQHVSILRPKSGVLDSRFLSYLLVSDGTKNQLLNIGDKAGATRQALTKAQLQAFAVPVPQMEEQKRIVAVLDQAFAALDRARAHAEANLVDAMALLAETRERLLAIDQPGWTSEQLEGLINIKHGFAFKSELFTTEGAHVLLTPGNFFEQGGFRSRGEKQKYYVGEIPAGFILQEGDLLMAMTEQAPGLLGSCVLVPESDRFLHNQRLGLIQPQKPGEWHSPYFAHVFNQKRFRKALSDTCTGIKVRHTSPDKIKAVYVPVPPTIEIQKSIADKLDTLTDWIRNLEVAYEAKLSDIANLRQSLLHKAFSGQL